MSTDAVTCSRTHNGPVFPDPLELEIANLERRLDELDVLRCSVPHPRCEGRIDGLGAGERESDAGWITQKGNSPTRVEGDGGPRRTCLDLRLSHERRTTTRKSRIARRGRGTARAIRQEWEE